MEEIKEKLKSYIKRVFKLKVLIPIIAILLVIIIITGATYVVMRWIATAAPKVASNYINSVTVGENGTISANMTSRQTWNEMIKAGYEIDKYLDGPEDLEKLINAELVTQYPDTRENVTKEIDWEALRKSNKEKKSQTESKETDKEYNILFIGNSKTFTNNLPNIFEQLAVSLGKKNVHAYSTEHNWGGAVLDSFLDEEDKFKDFSSRVKEKKWDYLVLQQQSDATLDAERTSNGAKRIIDYVKENSNKNVNVIYDAWGCDMSYNETTYGQVMQVFNKTQEDNGGTIAYIANQLIAFHDLYPDVQLDSGDGLHPNVAGSYLAACSTYKAIFGEKTQGATYNAGLSDKLVKNIQKCIDESDETNSVGDILQGVIKFKRHDENGSTFYLTYAEPGQMQEWKKAYSLTGNEQARQNALKHYTLKEKPKSTSNSSSAIHGKGSFPKYNLSEEDYRKIAIVCVNEQGDGPGAAYEASLIANRYELYGQNYSNIVDYLFNCGWFGGATGSGSCSESTLEDVKTVLRDGKRVFPKYIDEHVTFSSTWITSATNKDGPISNVEDKSQYKKWETVIQQSAGVGGGKYTFYSFPTEDSDPFGYISEDNRTKYGDFCYEYGTWKPINGEEDPNATDVHATSSGNSSSAAASEMGQKLVDFVKDKVGLPYVWRRQRR